MRMSDRTFYGRNRRISSGKYTLIVEERDLYTSYRITRGTYYDCPVILWHEVRNCEPVPIRPAQIIHARHIPWFLWIYYLVRDAIWRFRFNRENARLAKKEEKRRAAIRQLAKERLGPGRFGGRYNR